MRDDHITRLAGWYGLAWRADDAMCVVEMDVVEMKKDDKEA